MKKGCAREIRVLRGLFLVEGVREQALVTAVDYLGLTLCDGIYTLQVVQALTCIASGLQTGCTLRVNFAGVSAAL